MIPVSRIPAKLLRISLLLAMTIMVSCTFFRAPGADDCDKILERDQMKDILTDMYLLDAYLAEYQYSQPKVRDSIWHYYGGIFHKHNVTAHDFHMALECYLLDRDELDAIHEEILNRMSVMESELEYLDIEVLDDYIPDIPLGVVPDSL